MKLSPVDLLLVEDDSADAELILLSLDSVTASRTRHISDGEEAVDFLLCRGSYVDRLLEPLPRAVFLDLKLPRVSGLDVLRELRADRRTALVPIVMLTSSRVERDVLGAYRLGVNSFIQKPVDFEVFRRTVREAAAYWISLNEPPPVARR